MIRIRWSIILILSIFVPAGLFGETIRGLVVDEIVLLPQADYERTVEISLEEMLAIDLREEARFLEGVRLELLISNRLKQYYDSFGVAVHKQLTPKPKPGIQTFSGKRTFFHFLPFQNRVYITIPLIKPLERELPAGAFLVEEPVATQEFPILVSIIPIMKGIPDSVAEGKFFLTVRPLIAKRGLLKLSLQPPPGKEEEELEIYIDDQQVGDTSDSIEMEAGIHHLKVRSLVFKEVNASFTIESGKTSQVEILLEEIASQLSIEAPEGAEVYLDGEKLIAFADSSYQLSEGNHTVWIKVGDYSFSKRFLAKAGKNYHLSCVFDIIINED